MVRTIIPSHQTISRTIVQHSSPIVLVDSLSQARNQTTPIGATKIFRGAIVTGHRTQLTIAITDSATSMKIGLQNNAASEASRIFVCLYPQL